MRRAIGWLLAVMALAFVPAVAFAEGVAQDTQTEVVEVAVEGVNTIDAVGTTHEVAGNTFEVTSSSLKTVAFTKSKNAKSITVPAKVKINGKYHKVTSIGSKAFAPAKKKLTKVVIGKNVTVIGASAFAGCKKLAQVTGGASVKTIEAKGFLGCERLKDCAPFSSKALTKVGKSALKKTKRLKTLTVKSKKLEKESVTGALKGSSVKTVKVAPGTKKLNKKYAEKYKKIFTKKNCGKKVVVKA